MIYIAPSLLAANFADLKTDVARMEDAGANYLHLDVMDGHFVPNISFGAGVVSDLRKVTQLYFDVHLMISEPLRYVDSFVKAGADIVTFHYESEKDPMQTLLEIKAREIRCGIAISPRTPAEALYPFISVADMLLVMTVEPGFGGQSLIPECVDKVRLLRREAIRQGVNINIEVDGGITADNTAHLTEAGANVLVAGSALFKTKRPRTVMQKMREEAKSHPFAG